ncbi:hypothetical protein EJ08DRAFT_678040 [Tothia fuscella]|uniref:PHD-type domain-containing protein n=1 Tax=Tothia fuscella TaxID=1048955 RepID=A0A9P4NTG3_9PEZI|nr:hypothetical protein EJ08DRAFT_678040 [Tothia fuscella]
MSPVLTSRQYALIEKRQNSVTAFTPNLPQANVATPSRITAIKCVTRPSEPEPEPEEDDEEEEEDHFVDAVEVQDLIVVAAGSNNGNDNVSDSDSDSLPPINCICEVPHDTDMICCEDCNDWFHYTCVRVTAEWCALGLQWFCFSCRPALHTSTTAPPTQPSALRQATNLGWDAFEKLALFLTIKSLAPFKGKTHMWDQVSAGMKSKFAVERKTASCKNQWLRYESFERGYDERDAVFVRGSDAKEALKRSQQKGSGGGKGAGTSTPSLSPSAPVPTARKVKVRLAPNVVTPPASSSPLGQMAQSRKRCTPADEDDDDADDEGASPSPPAAKKQRVAPPPPIIIPQSRTPSPSPSPSPPPQPKWIELFGKVDEVDALAKHRALVGDVWNSWGDVSMWSKGFGPVDVMFYF